MSNAVIKAKKYLLRKCATGTGCACDKAKRVFATERMQISAGSMVTFADADENGTEHPNKMPFRGVLLLVDQASTKPPHGSRGHRIYVPKDVAKEKLSGIIGMAVNYDATDLDSHQTRHKVGIVTKAGITGNQVWVRGFIYKKDFPEAARDLKKAGLGMSMELADVYVRDEDEDVWHLEDFEFTGATILKKTAAAYYGTELTAKATAVASGKKRERKMAKTQEKESRVAAASGSGQGALLVEAIKGSLAPLVEQIKASNDATNQLRNDVEELKGLYILQAAAADEDVEDDTIEAAKEDEDDEMEAAKSKDEEDGEEADDEGEEDDLDAGLEDLEEEAVEQEPGELNKDAKNKGKKNSVTKPPKQGIKAPGGVSEGRLKSAGKPFPGLKSSAAINAAAVQISTLNAQVQKMRRLNRTLIEQMKAQAEEHKAEVKKLRGKYASMEAQAEKWSEQVSRRSAVPVEIKNLMAKASVDPHAILAGRAEKLPVEAVDHMFAVAAEQGITIDTTTRAAYKNRMHELGLMESGASTYGS